MKQGFEYPTCQKTERMLQDQPGCVASHLRALVGAGQVHVGDAAELVLGLMNNSPVV